MIVNIALSMIPELIFDTSVQCLENNKIYIGVNNAADDFLGFGYTV
jgi:hypothetical protein